jgi:hypothetical protein
MEIAREEVTQRLDNEDLRTLQDTEFISESEGFIVCSLQLFEGLAEGLRDNFIRLVNDEQEKFGKNICHCIGDQSDVIRCHAFGLVGTLCESSYPQLIAPLMPVILPSMLHNFQPDHPQACNNAVWLLGEIATKGAPGVLVSELPKIRCAMVSLLKMVDQNLEFDPLESSIMDLAQQQQPVRIALRTLYSYNAMPISVRFFLNQSYTNLDFDIQTYVYISKQIMHSTMYV